MYAQNYINNYVSTIYIYIYIYIYYIYIYIYTKVIV